MQASDISKFQVYAVATFFIIDSGWGFNVFHQYRRANVCRHCRNGGSIWDCRGYVWMACKCSDKIHYIGERRNVFSGMKNCEEQNTVHRYRINITINMHQHLFFFFFYKSRNHHVFGVLFRFFTGYVDADSLRLVVPARLHGLRGMYS